MISSGPAPPTQAHLRRAISSAYYALFHALARAGADLLAGDVGADRSDEAWRQAYRALEHGNAERACRTDEVKTLAPGIRVIADQFVALQKQRHDADYDPLTNYTQADAETAITRAQAAIATLDATPVKHRRAFCAYILFRQRR